MALRAAYERFARVVAALDALVLDAHLLEGRFQKLVAETVLLRMFYHLEGMVEAVALRLARNMPYCDGVRPSLICAPFRSVAAAEANILGAAAGRAYIKWTTLNNVTRNMRGILAPTDHFLVHRGNHDGQYEEIRKVRNHIAHATPSTRREYGAVLNRAHGAGARVVAPGSFLLAHRPGIPGLSPPYALPVIRQYFGWADTFVKTMVKT